MRDTVHRAHLSALFASEMTPLFENNQFSKPAKPFHVTYNVVFFPTAQSMLA